MLTAESFEKIINAIQSINKETQELGGVISKYFDGHLICMIGDKAIAVITEEVERSIIGNQIYSGWINWWLYESSKNIAVDDVDYQIKTPIDLYHLLTEQYAQLKGTNQNER